MMCTCVVGLLGRQGMPSLGGSPCHLSGLLSRATAGRINSERLSFRRWNLQRQQEIHWSKRWAIVNRLYCPAVPLLARKWLTATGGFSLKSFTVWQQSPGSCVHAVAPPFLPEVQAPAIPFSSCIIYNLWFLRVFVFTVRFLHSHMLIHCYVLPHWFRCFRFIS